MLRTKNYFSSVWLSYTLKYFDAQDNTVLVAYENDPDAQEAAAKIITGDLIRKVDCLFDNYLYNIFIS